MKTNIKLILTLLALSIAASSWAQQVFYAQGLKCTYWGGDCVSVATADINIRQIAIPDIITYQGNTFNVCEISPNGFAGCTQLEEVVLPSHPIAILKGAFKGCSSLKAISCESTTPHSIGDHPTFGTDERGVFEPYHFARVNIFVPQECANDYRKHPRWRAFSNILTIDHQKFDLERAVKVAEVFPLNNDPKWDAASCTDLFVIFRKGSMYVGKLLVSEKKYSHVRDKATDYGMLSMYTRNVSVDYEGKIIGPDPRGNGVPSVFLEEGSFGESSLLQIIFFREEDVKMFKAQMREFGFKPTSDRHYSLNGVEILEGRTNLNGNPAYYFQYQHE